jgi:hypothetical protein
MRCRGQKPATSRHVRKRRANARQGRRADFFDARYVQDFSTLAPSGSPSSLKVICLTLLLSEGAWRMVRVSSGQTSPLGGKAAAWRTEPGHWSNIGLDKLPLFPGCAGVSRSARLLLHH